MSLWPLQVLVQMCIDSKVLRQMVILQLLLSSVAQQNIHASPFSSPEISMRSDKTTVATSQQIQQHQKPNLQDLHLNSLNAYATNYDSISTASAQANFRPSYKITEIDASFKPIQGSDSLTSTMTSPTPVLMQYLPQTVHEGGVQYLQLIPTRPLIVPISSYLQGGALASQTTMAYHQPLTVNNAITDHYGRSPSLLTEVHANIAPSTPTALTDIYADSLPYGLQTYTNAIQPYRNNYRINREIKGKHVPGSFTLNLNEYLPGSHNLLQPNYLRGRP